MQREKLYNLQYKTYVNCVFLSQNKQYSERPILNAAKSSLETFVFY